MKSSSASSDMHAHTPTHTAEHKSPVVSWSFTAARPFLPPYHYFITDHGSDPMVPTNTTVTLYLQWRSLQLQAALHTALQRRYPPWLAVPAQHANSLENFNYLKSSVKRWRQILSVFSLTISAMNHAEVWVCVIPLTLYVISTRKKLKCIWCEHSLLFFPAIPSPEVWGCCRWLHSPKKTKLLL